MKAGGVSSGSGGEVPARSSLGEVPELDHLSDTTGGSDADQDARDLHDRAAADPDRVAGRVVAKYQGVYGTYLPSNVSAVVQRLSHNVLGNVRHGCGDVDGQWIIDR